MRKILVVEDDPNILDHIAEILEFEDFNVICAEDGKLGLKYAQEELPDLIISDIMMPHLDGHELLESLQTDPATQTIPFIFLTALADQNSLRQGMLAGADDYLTKPFTAAELLESIAVRLRKHDNQMKSINTGLEQIELLRQVDEELSYRLNPHWVTMIAIDWAIRRTNAKVAMMGIVDEQTAMLRIEHLSGLIDIVPTQDNLIPFNRMLTEVIEQVAPITVSDYDTSEYRPLQSDMRSGVAIPMIADDNIVGIIVLESDKTDGFRSGDTLFLLQIANRAAISWQHSYLFNQLLAQKDRELKIQEIFGRFVSKEVADLIQGDEYALKGEQRKVAILFCDIRGFTLFSDTLAPYVVIDILNAYFSIVVAAAQKFGGFVNKFVGDAVLIVYGAPNKMENCTYNALRTAELIQQDFQQLNEFRKLQNDMPINVGIGINTGDVIAGAVGTKTRQEYTVIGDSVNLASRIESMTKEFDEYNILISEFSYDDLDNFQQEFPLTDLGKMPIRGKSQQVGIYGIQKD